MKEFQTKKKFGQNFLTDKNLLSAICDDAELTESDEVLEIGPGMGTLTEAMSSTAKKVISYEIDKELQPILEGKNLKNVEFIFQDIMDQKLEEIENKFSDKYKLVANIPYYITTPILFKFLGNSKKLQSITVMVQKEVAERMVAKEGDKDYGVLSVSISVLGGAKIKRIVGKNMFSPPPKVDSAVVTINIKNCEEIENMKDFFEFVKKIFSMRRKTLLNNLSIGCKISRSELVKVFSEEILARRPESFSVEEIKELYKKYLTLC